MTSSLFEKKLLITIGTGGVGKTSVSAAFAIRAAMQGKRVLVITIDPAKRLKTALGLDKLENNPVKLEHSLITGSLHIGLLDPKEIFDRFIVKNIHDKEKQTRILNNRLYNKISSVLAGSQEFTSIEWVLSEVDSNNYDLVVLDTPPAQHAIDFLKGPQKFYELFDDKVIKWFQGSEGVGVFQKLMASGTKKAIGILEKLVGKDFLTEIFDFFEVIGDLAPIIREVTVKAQKLFSSDQTAFSLVTTYDEVKNQEARELYRSLKRSGYNLSYVFLNRYFSVPTKNTKNENLNKLISGFTDLYGHQNKIEKAIRSDLTDTLGIIRIEEQESNLANLDEIIGLANSILLDEKL